MLSPGDRVLVVGAGFAGAAYARTLAEAGLRVQVIDRRLHIAGNAYDEIDERGTRIHRYGPHLFHTSNEKVWRWLNRFGAFTPYEHRVSVAVKDRFVPLPVSRTTFEAFFDKAFETEADLADFLRKIVVPCEQPTNAAQYLSARIGVALTDTLFRPYTKKMWGLDLEDLDASVVKRIPVRLGRENRYFPDDKFQALPRDGYAAVFGNILDHDNISVTLGAEFDRRMEAEYDFCLLSAPIDAYFDYRFGELPYRSIFFHHAVADRTDIPTATVNFSDASRFTRTTYWERLPGHASASGRSTMTTEVPCDYKDNQFERYYPVKDAAGVFAERYRRYAELAKATPTLQFIGRCGTYAYLDMHQVINQSLMHAQRLLPAGLRDPAFEGGCLEVATGRSRSSAS